MWDDFFVGEHVAVETLSPRCFLLCFGSCDRVKCPILVKHSKSILDTLHAQCAMDAEQRSSDMLDELVGVPTFEFSPTSCEQISELSEYYKNVRADNLILATPRGLLPMKEYLNLDDSADYLCVAEQKQPLKSQESHSRNFKCSDGEATVEVLSKSQSNARQNGQQAISIRSSESAEKILRSSDDKISQRSKFLCGVCNITINGTTSLAAHVAGARHRKAEIRTHAAALSELVANRAKISLEKEQSTKDKGSSASEYRCDACDVICNSSQSMLEHVAGARHIRIVAKSNFPI